MHLHVHGHEVSSISLMNGVWSVGVFVCDAVEGERGVFSVGPFVIDVDGPRRPVTASGESIEHACRKLEEMLVARQRAGEEARGGR